MDDTIPTAWLPDPKVFSACTPTKIAPTVWAIVLTVKIEINGLLISSFNTFKVLANAFPSFFFIVINVGVMLNKTASNMEHKKENTIDRVA